MCLADGDDEVAAFLRTLGSSPAAIRTAVTASTVFEEPLRSGRGRPSLTGAAQAALGGAIVRAGSPRRVRAEHVWLSLCWGAATVAGGVLRELGVRPGDWEGFVRRRSERSA